MLEGCAARAGLATGELSDVMKIQAQIIGSLIRKAAVEVSLHPARIQGSEAKGAVCGEHRNESTPWRKRPRSGFGAWCVLLPPRVAQHYAEADVADTRSRASCGAPKHVAFKCPHKFVTTKRKRKCESATRKTLNMAVGALLLRGRLPLGPFCESCFGVLSDHGVFTSCSSLSSRDTRTLLARGIAAVPGPADRPAIFGRSEGGRVQCIIHPLL